jgi:aspartate/methionine/tyrosine aminotransferase
MAPSVARRGLVPPFIVMDVMRAANERAAEGGHVLHLEVGQPATGAPEPVLEAARRALTGSRLGYTDALGLELLRRRIARHYGENCGIDVDWRRIVVTTGSSGAFILAFLAAFDAGDPVAVACPGYPAYRNILAALGVDVVTVPVGPATNFQPTPELLDDAGRERNGNRGLKGLIVASPANPTGTMLDRGALQALVEDCRERSLWLVSDEIYHGITYGAAASTALAFTDDAIVINSFSKYYSMTGWRLGWMVLPDRLLRSVECLAQNLFISPPTLSQHAAAAVFDCGAELDGNVARYAENRRLLLRELPEAGFAELAAADGAFYLYADVSHMTNDSQAFCRRMLQETGVAITPGLDFDPDRGHRFVRFSFAGSREDIGEAARRLVAWRR